MTKLSIDFLRWFTGKSLEAAQAALALVEQSIELGGWVPGASRKCRAAFNKANVARKIYNKNPWLEELRSPGEGDYSNAGFAIRMALTYGSWGELLEVDFSKLTFGHGRKPDLAEQAVIADIAQYQGEIAPLLAAMDALDRSRPKPVFTVLGVSPTLTRTMEDLGAVKIEVCEIEWKKVEYTNKKGERGWRWVGKLLWPAGTMHGTSRYGFSQSGNKQCEACGHAIKNIYNWVPLVVWHKDGTPQSLWTGRDCAESIFGIKMTGDLELEDTHGDDA